MKKAYATIEFMISGAFFLAFVVFVLLQTGSQLLHHYVYSDNAISVSRSSRLFYMLFFLPGKPENWANPLAAEAIGFSDRLYEINRTKLEAFMNECQNNYPELVRKIGRPFYISVSTETESWKCPAERRLTTIKRTMTMDGQKAVVEVGTV